MSWQIIIAGLAGVFISYLFRYKVNDHYNFVEYQFFEWRALAKGLIGGGVAVLVWTYVSTVLAWFGVGIDWPPLDWKLAAVVGFAGRKIYELAPQAFTYVAAIFKKKFEV